MNSKPVLWIARIVGILLCCQFAFSAAVKLFPEKLFPEMPAQMAKMGLPETILPTVAFLEILCVVTYLIPQTAILGAVLFTGYLGGAMLTHIRVGEPVYMHVGLGILLWLSLYIREPRLRALLPIRKNVPRAS